jgi:hypothetical protein
MGRTARRIAVMTPIQAEAFAKLVRKLAADIGTIECMRVLNLSTTVYYGLVNDGYITDKQATLLMEKYRAYKSSRNANKYLASAAA